MNMSDSRPSTIYDVARLAGVSHQTVSRLVKGASNVNPELRARIEKALSELDYHPNQAARTLTTRKSRVIGAIVHDISEIGPSLIIQGASERAREAGYFLEIVTVASQDPVGTESSIDLLKGREFAGIIAVSPSDEVAAPINPGRLLLPVHIAHAADDDDEQSINQLGMTMLIDHLAGLGHERFFLISGPRETLSARNRAAAYAATLEHRGLISTGIGVGDWSARSGYGVIADLGSIDFTAMVAANDQMALGAIASLNDKGLAVPSDVSVVGFDDIAEAEFFRPPLTTIAQNTKQQGRIAVDTLLRQIDPTVSLPPLARVRPELKVRESTASPRADL
ncbi:MAG TPA: LacI family DNA-binding transcriptional regulator [Galbitalea sp.]|jgi:LacI family transcriptional regulator|nr:LacI family DNA-binding transcriptional regulator [Galbitalea sp.]